MHYSTLAYPALLAALQQHLVHAATTSSASSPTATGISKSNLSPNGQKAGLSGFIGIEDIAGFAELAPYISWYSDYTANTSSSQGVAGIGMLWGAKGSACKDVYSPRLEAFTDLVDTNKTVPEIMFGFYEPDCDCSMSSDMSVSSAASAWDKLVVPLAAKGTVLGSPSMCKQYNEDFLTSFNSSIKQSWDVTSIHINKPNVSEAMKDVEYYVQKYQKPIWVSEFACVHDEDGFKPCTDQGDIDDFINDMVVYLENSTDVVAYGASNGAGLGKTWPLFDSPGSGELTKSGQTYLNTLKKLCPSGGCHGGANPSATAAQPSATSTASSGGVQFVSPTLTNLMALGGMAALSLAWSF